MNYTDFSEDERKFYLSESGFDSREKEFFRLRVYEEKTLFETAEIMGWCGIKKVDILFSRIS